MVAENYPSEWLIRKQKKKKKEKKAKKGKPNIQTNEQIGGQMNVSWSLVDSQLWSGCGQGHSNEMIHLSNQFNL